MDEAYRADELFHTNEVQANRLISIVLIITAAALGLVWAAAKLKIFPLSDIIIQPAAMQGIAETLILYILCKVVKNDAWWLKYLLLIAMIVAYARIDSMLTHKVVILMVIPVLCSSRYFSQGLSIRISIVCIVCFAVSAVIGSRSGWLNINDVLLPPGTQLTTTTAWIASAVENMDFDRTAYLKDTILFSYLPKLLQFLLASIISWNIAGRGKEMVLSQKKMSEQQARLEVELNLASGIQNGMLPATFPAFPDRSEFDLYASMMPAKEVGGDFYDFFLIDDDHLALVIADVSGKGVPAALFMMAAMILVKTHVKAGSSPADIFTTINDEIASNNDNDMFVTVWLGILDIRTGEVTAANAGHEYPILRGADRRFSLMKDPHSLAIGAMAGTRYRQYSFTLQPGDQLFVYTDGVTEANDPGGALYGTDRLMQALNDGRSDTPKDVLETVKASVGAFVHGAPQFDDETMLCLHYKGPTTLPEGGTA